jgi:hypothetical protein
MRPAALHLGRFLELALSAPYLRSDTADATGKQSQAKAADATGKQSEAEAADATVGHCRLNQVDP